MSKHPVLAGVVGFLVGGMVYTAVSGFDSGPCVDAAMNRTPSPTGCSRSVAMSTLAGVAGAVAAVMWARRSA